MSTENRDRVRRALREFRKYEGDGAGGTGALPVGDPASGPHNPEKSELREALEPVALGLDNVNTSVAAAQTARAGAETARTGAETAQSGAESARDLALAYRNAAFDAKEGAENAAIAAGASVFPDTAAGLAATSDGDVFLVPDEFSLIAYENDNGTAVELTRFGGFTQSATGATATTVNAVLQDLTMQRVSSRAVIPTLTVAATVDAIRTDGFAAAGDGGGALYKRVGSEPSHAGKVQSADGAWWGLAVDKPQPKQFGAVGDYDTDDTDALAAWIEYGTVTGKTLGGVEGVFSTTDGLPPLERVSIHGPGAPRLGVFPLQGDDKEFMRPGYKHLLPGMSIMLKGTGARTHTTRRTDRFASFSYGLLVKGYRPCTLSGFAIVMDMDVYDADGNLTTVATDNRADYDVGLFIDDVPSSHFIDIVVFGYFPVAGRVLYSRPQLETSHGTPDPDYNVFTGGSSMGDIGTAIIGAEDTESFPKGLSGTQFFHSDFFANDHHSRSDVDNQWGTTSLYVDGYTTGTAPNKNIAGINIFGGHVRTHVDAPMAFDHANTVIFQGTVFELPNRPASTGATKAVPTGTSETFGIGFINCRHLNPVAAEGFYSFAASLGGAFIHSDPRYGNVGVTGGKGGVMLRGGSQTNPSLQIARDHSSSVNGWTSGLPNVGSDVLETRYGGTLVETLSTAGVHSPNVSQPLWERLTPATTLTIASGAVTANRSYHRISNGGAAGNLNQIDGGTVGDLLYLQPNVTADAITFTHGGSGGNIRTRDGSSRLMSGTFEMFILLFDGTNWRIINR